MKRICKYCGVEYDGDPGGSCCPDCAKKIKSTSVRERICTVCGVSFPGGPSARFCPNCRIEQKRKATHEYKQRKATGNVRKIGSIDICAVCGKPYTVAGGLQKYCPDCSYEAIREKDRAKSIEWNRNHLTPDQRKIERNTFSAPIKCVVCGKMFIPKFSSVTCSKECSESLQKSRLSSWESNNKDRRKLYRKNKYHAKIASMTPEECKAYRDKINEKARENYKKRKERL